jgi:predicted Zn finger-like uncharacterized protein
VLSCSKYQEFQVAEAIHCPSCSTRYRLRPERLKPVIRRAKCFSCGSLFPVGDVVQRLLALPAPSDTSRFKVEDVAAVQHTPLDPFVPPPSLTPGDLEGVDEEILEKTLVDAPTSLPETKVEPSPTSMTLPVLVIPTVAPAPAEPIPPPEAQALPEPMPPPEAQALPESSVPPEAPVPPEPMGLREPEAAASEFPPELTEATLSGYTSARDAIDKLLGNAPAAATGLKLQPDAHGMDMEATLSVLDTTLGGTRTVPMVARATKGDGPTASGMAGDAPSASTMRLSREDLEAALAPPPKAKTEEPTAALRPSDLMVFSDEPSEVLPLVAPKSFPPSPDAQETGTELLRLKIGEEIYSNLTMTQLTAWVEEGRILENHLVARQHSENWLEAHKVPGLRPVFERLRRERNDVIGLISGPGEIAPKKSLFGGLFGRG